MADIFKIIPQKPLASSIWFAVYTKPRAEKLVHKRLCDKGIESFLPLRKQLKVWSDRKKWVEEPAFKSYIFVKIPLKEYFNILNTYGVVKFITFGGKPAAIPDNQIFALKRICSEDTEYEISDVEVKPGDPIEIISGPLMGIVGELISVNGNKRVAVKIEHLGRTIILNVSMSLLRISELEQKYHGNALKKVLAY